MESQSPRWKCDNYVRNSSAQHISFSQCTHAPLSSLRNSNSSTPNLTQTSHDSLRSSQTRVNESDALASVEDAFQQTFTQTLDRFYTLFSSVVTYHEDLTKFLKDLDEGYFIQYTLDNLLQETTGKQLLCEVRILS